MPRTPHFVQITALGWTRFDTLVAWNGTAARLWTRLARSIDGQGVVVSTAVALAADLGVSAATVRRHLAHLESVRAFIRFRLPGGMTAFAMNPNEVWSGKPSARSRAPYTTGVLGGASQGQAALRRGSWFLPGMEPVQSQPSKPRSRRKTGPQTGDLFAGTPHQNTAPTSEAPIPEAPAALDAPDTPPAPHTPASQDVALPADLPRAKHTLLPQSRPWMGDTHPPKGHREPPHATPQKMGRYFLEDATTIP